MMASSPPLRRVVDLSRSLHNGSLSLSQLVPVHQALITSVVVLVVAEENDKDANATNLSSVLAALCHDEADYCHELLKEGGESMLLAIQFLLHHVPGLRGLTRVVVPVLEELVSVHPSEELREAVLDTVFQAGLTTNATITADGLQEYFDQCSCIDWILQCRILVRLGRAFPDHQTVKDHLVDFILQGMTTLDQLRPITAWLLPVLYNDNKDTIVDESITDRLWRKLMKMKQEDDSTKTALIATAVLCTILPFISHTDVVTLSEGESGRSKPLYHEFLWTLIQESLNRGTNVTLKAGKFAFTDEAEHQILRRRGLYLLRLIMESISDRKSETYTTWMKYIMCFENLEMEFENHLIDQVWEPVADLCYEAAATPTSSPDTAYPPPMTWSWISSMLCRLFLADTPVLRKLALFRLLCGRAGIDITKDQTSAPPPEKPLSETEKKRQAIERKPQKKHAIKSKKGKQAKCAPLSIVSIDFVLYVLLPAYDTIGASVGTNMNYEEGGKIKQDDLRVKTENFLIAYVHTLRHDPNKLSEFLAGILSARTLGCLRPVNIVMVLEKTGSVLMDLMIKESVQASLEPNVIATAAESLRLLFSNGSVVFTFRIAMLTGLATILSASTLESAIDPKTLLKVLTMFPQKLVEEQGDSDFFDSEMYQSLQKWTAKLGNSDNWADNVAAACSTAYVQGDLLDMVEYWDPRSGTSESEMSFGAAIVLLTVLSNRSSAASLLWPAIHKGLSSSPTPTTNWLNAGKAGRAAVLLEHGCRMQVLSGLGNGDLVVHKETEQMMVPPPSVESILSNTVSFLLCHIRALASLRKDSERELGGAIRSATKQTSKTLGRLISQLKVLHVAYPSSMAISNATEELLLSSMEALMNVQDNESIDAVTYTTLVFASLSCGADPTIHPEGTSSMAIFEHLLALDYNGTKKKFGKEDAQVLRSIFAYSRWGCLSCLMPTILETSETEKLKSVLENVFNRGLDLVEATPTDALLPLFETVRVGAQKWCSFDRSAPSYQMCLDKIIRALFAAMNEMTVSTTKSYMLNELCGLIFRPSLLLDEYERLKDDKGYGAPIREAFRSLYKMAGTKRPYILKTALCHIGAGWLGTLDGNDAGVAAIPYKKEIIKLLIHKEAQIDTSSTNQSELMVTSQTRSDVLSVPPDTHYSSIARGFILVFLSRLPDPNDGLDQRVLTKLLHPMVLKILRDNCFAPLKSGSTLMTGTVDYTLRIRSWQALCILSRFVTEPIADEVCVTCLRAMEESQHGQIRYFLEIFGMQCFRKHFSIFGSLFVKDIQRTDLSLQHVASLMIISGNVMVGRYAAEFARHREGPNGMDFTIHQVISGVIPWLSSTQAFSRGLAQLLVFKLFPLVMDVSKSGDNGDSDWYLRNLHVFLRDYPEIKRLRNKQLRMFEKYDADQVCSIEGMMSFKTDEGAEAHPEHLVDVLKQCLKDVYLESHGDSTPCWKQVEDMHSGMPGEDSNVTEEETLVNFQRKIIPLDALDLAMADARESRLRNGAGRIRQSLIVCAALVEKIPNLGGLARTSEIFAADRLIIPDISVVKMDNFKSLSVGAGDWVNIEECKEHDLRKWLVQRKEEGYAVVGLEQTSSSMSIKDYSFPEKTVLLLGKEKEGIPVEFLQLVDQCVEIPQLGVIRSLNVHVSGAICIWEYSKQNTSSTG